MSPSVDTLITAISPIRTRHTVKVRGSGQPGLPQVMQVDDDVEEAARDRATRVQLCLPLRIGRTAEAVARHPTAPPGVEPRRRQRPSCHAACGESRRSRQRADRAALQLHGGPPGLKSIATRHPATDLDVHVDRTRAARHKSTRGRGRGLSCDLDAGARGADLRRRRTTARIRARTPPASESTALTT